MAYTKVQRGSRGDSVKQLQELLNKNGYTLNPDGVFGPLTENALKDYQTKNSLSYDGTGIAGDETWTKLNGGTFTKPVTTADQLKTIEGSQPTYTESDALKAASADLAAYQQGKPGDYTSQYGDKIQAILDNILNRKDFSYDFSADPMYQQYKDRFQLQGQQAMMDTMGEAAALSGGYGNSYGAVAGQQVYNANLNQMNDVIPQLQQAALAAYDNEGNKMQSNLGNLENMDQADYAKYSNDVADYYNTLNFKAGQVQNIENNEKSTYNTDLNKWESDRDYWFNKNQAEIAAAEKAAALSSGGGHGRGGGGGKKSAAYGDVLSYAKAHPKDAKGYIERMVDGGSITADEGAYIYQVILGGTVTPPAANPSNNADQGSNTDPTRFTGWKNGHYYVNGVMVS